MNGLHELHVNNILHRGLNLRNIMINDQANILISDLFLSKLFDI